METCFLLIFFTIIEKFAVQWGVISFPRFSNGVFSKIQWGWGPLNGVSVKWMGFQWGWLKVNGVDHIKISPHFLIVQ